MDIAYVISAYKLPAQLVRLVRRLHGRGVSVAVHVDRKTPAREYELIVDGLRGLDRVELLPRHRCYWGSFGHVEASLKGIAHLLREGIAFDYLVLLTGQDYPIRHPRLIASFLDAAAGRSFMSSWPLPHRPWSGRGGLDRIERWHLVGPSRLHVELPVRRRPPRGLQFRGGSPYWCLARPLVEHVQRVVDTRPEVVGFFRRTYIPDEMFFQTVLAGSPYAASIVDDNLRYIDWSCDPAPCILTLADLPRIVESEKLFARKFDASVDSSVLDRLDAHLETQVEALPR